MKGTIILVLALFIIFVFLRISKWFEDRELHKVFLNGAKKDMLYPVVSLDSWIKQYDLKPIERKCKNCNQVLKTTIPVATKLSRGLASPPHSCGPEYDLVSLKPIDAEFLRRINSIRNHLSD